LEQVDGVAVNSKAEVVARLNFLAKQRPDFDTSGLRPTVTVFTFDEAAPDGTDVVSNARNEEPDVLPAPWEERVSRSNGDVYYFNPETDESTYDRPTASQKAIKHDEGDLQHELFVSPDDVAATNGTAPGTNSIDSGNNTSDRQEVSLLSPDASLPAGWTTKQSRSTGATYYLNLLTADEQHEKPTLPALSSQEDLHTDGSGYKPGGTVRSPKRTAQPTDTDQRGDQDGMSLHNIEHSSSSNPLRTVQELLRRHQAATVFQSNWRGKVGRRAVDTAMSFALFQRFADRDEVTIGADGQRVVLGPALRHRKCNELLVLCGLDEAERGHGVANRCAPRELQLHKTQDMRDLHWCRDRQRVDADAFWQFTGLSKTEPLGFESFMAALSHFQALQHMGES
jgi:hypothetical protein